MRLSAAGHPRRAYSRSKRRPAPNAQAAHRRCHPGRQFGAASTRPRTQRAAWRVMLSQPTLEQRWGEIRNQRVGRVRLFPAAHATPHLKAFRGLALLGELGREGGPATRAPAVPGRGLSAGGSGVGASTPPLPPPPPATPAAAAAARRRLGLSSEGVTIRASYAAMRASLTAHARALARASLTRRAFFSSIYAALARPPLSSGWVAGGGVGLRDVGCGVWGVGVGK